mmetsp:Transcript_15135/g.61928  ORF Transcript_15135/g.61928 Transcript_15135/m.61928 type:complete len:149 (-) Transcript_15135:830-1276(-)
MVEWFLQVSSETLAYNFMEPPNHFVLRVVIVQVLEPSNTGLDVGDLVWVNDILKQRDGSQISRRSEAIHCLRMDIKTPCFVDHVNDRQTSFEAISLGKKETENFGVGNAASGWTFGMLSMSTSTYGFGCAFPESIMGWKLSIFRAELF